jgi:plastocyanin
MKLTAVLAVLAALAAAIVAAGPAAAGPSSTPNVVKVTALSSGLAYNKKVLRARPGKVKLVLTNLSPLDHDVRVAKGGHDLGGTKEIGKGKTIGTVALKKGTYTFFCSVPGHEAAGMKGKLIVS